jgi:hypothetical protein
VAILPLTSPHLLYYDLVTLFPMGLILLDEEWRKPPVDGLRRMILLFWLSISAYMLVFTFVGHFSPSSLILLVILLTVWTLFVQKAVNVPAMAIETAADRSSR